MKIMNQCAKLYCLDLVEDVMQNGHKCINHTIKKFSCIMLPDSIKIL